MRIRNMGYSFDAELNLAREDKIMVYCSHLELSAEEQEAVAQLLKEGPDWDLLIAKSEWQRISPLVSLHLLSDSMRRFVPQSIQNRLENVVLTVAVQNMFLQDELSRVLAVFNRCGVPVIVLKGGALLSTIYSENVGLRPMADLDILVHPEDIHRAQNIVLNNGYRWFARNADLRSDNRENRHLPNLVNSQKGTFLEVHQNIVDTGSPYYRKLSGFWSRSQPTRICDAYALTLGIEDNLIHLGINFLSDRSFRNNNALGQLIDISEIIRKKGKDINWDLVEATANEFGFTGGMHSVLYVCASLLNTDLPSSFMADIQPREFNPFLLDLFIRRRILDNRPWLAHNLVAHRQAHSRTNIAISAVRRFLSVPEIKLTGEKNPARIVYLYLKRLRDVLTKIIHALLKPSDLREDIMLDKWLHDLYYSKNIRDAG